MASGQESNSRCLHKISMTLTTVRTLLDLNVMLLSRGSFAVEIPSEAALLFVMF
jgi:hypothetical protein